MFDMDDCVGWLAVNSAKKIADSFNDILQKEGITRVQWIALFYLGKHGELSQLELAKKLNIKGSTVARLIDRMEAQGYIKREKAANDRRVTNISLTNMGAELRQHYIPFGDAFNKKVQEGITEAEMEIFKTVLKKMVDNVY